MESIKLIAVIEKIPQTSTTANPDKYTLTIHGEGSELECNKALSTLFNKTEYLEACRFVDPEIVKAEGLGRAVEVLKFERDKLWEQMQIANTDVRG